jgi:hypothetical protein
MTRLLAAIVIVAAVGQLAQAQRGAGLAIAPVHSSVPMHVNHPFAAPVFLGGDWYPGYNSEIVQTSPPQVIVLQPAAPEVKEETKPITPLLIELQDGHYVRSDRVETDHVETGLAPSVARQKSGKMEQIGRTKSASNLQTQSRPVPAAMLIFRDGHREQVSEYTIADGIIYAHGDYWVNGYWNKKIFLSSLDLPATLSANQQSGSDFELPSGPNVVVVRP